MKSIIDFDSLSKEVLGLSVPKPTSGTLSGHAAGEPFDKAVYAKLLEKYPDLIFRQYEYLNFLYSSHLDAVGTAAKNKLFNSPTVLFLLSRGKNATDKWSISNPFEEKQNDTADILAVKDDFFNLIDVKTRNMSKKAQPPNIISSYKLAQLCATMLDNEDFNSFTIDYFEVDWRLAGEHLVCENAHYANLFQATPSTLYINWAAAMQIQFHVDECDQTFQGCGKEWAKAYLRHFVEQAQERSQEMINRFVTPFLKYID
jgi:type II restriction enzyme